MRPRPQAQHETSEGNPCPEASRRVLLHVLIMPVPVAVVREVAHTVVRVVDVIAVLLRIVAATMSMLVVGMVLGLRVPDDVVDDTFVPVIFGGDVLERLRLLPHLRRDLRTHRMLLPTVDATRLPWDAGSKRSSAVA